MSDQPTAPTADFAFTFFPVHLSLLSAGENTMPPGYWTLISREPAPRQRRRHAHRTQARCHTFAVPRRRGGQVLE
jgi:hypothetical protein